MEYFKCASNFNILSTNARSLIPKIDCCVEYFKELETTLAFLTETWLLDSPELVADVEDLELETGYSMLYRNRPPNDRGYSAGGVTRGDRHLDLLFTNFSDRIVQSGIIDPLQSDAGVCSDPVS